VRNTIETELTYDEIFWIEQEIERATRTLELLLGKLLDKERERIRVNVTRRCLGTLQKGDG